LFLPFGLVLLVGCCYHKRWGVLLGGISGLLFACGCTTLIDPHGWTQYAHMMKSSSEIQRDFIPTISSYFRILVDPNRAWLQFVPVVISSCWALSYYWPRRHRWQWTDEGLLVLAASLLSAPHAWFTDEAVLLPVIIFGLLKAQRAGRSLIPFGIVIVAALTEILFKCQPTSPDYVWTTSAWLGLYLYAKWHHSKPALDAQIES